MSPDMPEFVMPPEVTAEPPAEQRAATLEHAAARSSGQRSRPRSDRDPTAEPPIDAAIAPAPAVDRRRDWRRLVAAALVGVLLGAGLASVAQGLDRAAADRDRSALTDAAMAYLLAIAEGRAEDATRLVPAQARGSETLLVDAPLRAARRIEAPSAGFAQIEGDRGRIDVGFLLGRVEVAHTLAAERAEDGWRVTTSLVEPVMHYGYAGVSLGGLLAPSGDALLYPALYTTDAVDDGFVSAQPITFGVDGDPDTPAQMAPEVRVAPGLAALVEPVAVAYARGCQVRPACGLPAGDLESAGDVQPHSGGVRDAELSVYVTRRDPADPEAFDWLEVRMRGDLTGAPETWECALPNPATGSLDPEPCVS